MSCSSEVDLILGLSGRSRLTRTHTTRFFGANSDRRNIGSSISSKSNRLVAERFLARAKRLEKPEGLHPWRTVRDAIGDLPDPELDPNWAKAFNNHRFQPGARATQAHRKPVGRTGQDAQGRRTRRSGGENMLSILTVRFATSLCVKALACRLFPDEFVFHGAWSETMRQLGNAVPVELARIIATDVKQHLSRYDKLRALS